MSERGVRRFAGGCVCRTEQVKQDYLFGDPDVVKLLRWVTHQLEVAERTGARIPRQEGMELGYRYVIGAIEAQFHVLLTNKGYEWTTDA